MSLSLTTDWSKIRYITFLIFSTGALLATTVATGLAVSGKHKRQLFRENLLPQQGGKIPDGALSPERLVLNKFNQNGFFVSDGYHLEQIIKPPDHNSRKKYQSNSLKIHGRPDDRYVAPPGRYHYIHRTVDTTYVIREPVKYVIYPVFYHQRRLPLVPQESLQFLRQFKSDRIAHNTPAAETWGFNDSQDFDTQIFKDFEPYLRKIHSLTQD